MNNPVEQITELAPARGLIPLDLREVFRYRGLIFFLAMRELKGRYRQMALGPLWMIIGPLVNAVLFAVLFGRLAGMKSEGSSYFLFSYSALVLWGFFSSVVQSAANSLAGAQFLIAKVYFPRLVLPFVGILVSAVNTLVALVILLALAILNGHSPSASWLAIPVYFAVAGLVGLAVGLWWAPWIVHFRDLQQVIDYGLKAWMYASPVAYATSAVPAVFRPYFELNPFTALLDGFRWSLYGTGSSHWPALVVVTLVCVPVLVAASYCFRRAERSIVDFA